MGKHTLFMVVVKIMKNRAVPQQIQDCLEGGGGLHVYGEQLGGLGVTEYPRVIIGGPGALPQKIIFWKRNRSPPPPSGSTTEIGWVAGK